MFIVFAYTEEFLFQGLITEYNPASVCGLFLVVKYFSDGRLLWLILYSCIIIGKSMLLFLSCFSYMLI